MSERKGAWTPGPTIYFADEKTEAQDTKKTQAGPAVSWWLRPPPSAQESRPALGDRNLEGTFLPIVILSKRLPGTGAFQLIAITEMVGRLLSFCRPLHSGPLFQEISPSRIFTVTPLSWREGPPSFKNCTVHPSHRKNSTCAFPSGLLINEGEGQCWLRGCLGLAKSPRALRAEQFFMTLPSLRSSLSLLGKETLPIFTR